jgi:hypothetical protein
MSRPHPGPGPGGLCIGRTPLATLSGPAVSGAVLSSAIIQGGGESNVVQVPVKQRPAGRSASDPHVRSIATGPWVSGPTALPGFRCLQGRAGPP